MSKFCNKITLYKRQWLVHILLALYFRHYIVSSLILPPADKIRMGMTEILRRECEDATIRIDDCAQSYFEINVKEGYQLAKAVFQHVVATSANRNSVMVWLPSCSNFEGEVERLTSVINENSDLLGGIVASFAHWPDQPSTVIELVWRELDPDIEGLPFFYEPESPEQVENAIRATESYVENTLVRLRLCPYTQSLQRAAIGLESVGVRAGPVGVRHAARLFDTILTAPVQNCKSTPAAVLATLYWQGVADLIEKPQEDVSTFLLVAPSCYDEDFSEFLYVCDSLIEKSVQLSRGSVGRVWFHPKYRLQEAEEAGTSRGGHAPPIEELKFLFDKNGILQPKPEDMARGHDKTRQTPHATINLLRTAQLKAAESKDTKENRSKTFVRNVVRILEDEVNDAMR